MQVLIKKILSINEDGASCHLIIIQQKYKIMLDCGINHSFQFHKYRQVQDQLKDVKLVLISHSALQYSGAYPFLVSQLKLSPKIFYTTQPIMRYSPLNLHQQILNLRLQGYDKKIFNRIYSQYEQMNLVKPFQKQEIQLFSPISSTTSLKQRNNQIKKIHFCCYLAGGYLGSVYWRISYGLVNILYLIEYNNYNMYHINGLDIDNLKNQTAHLLITDVYQPTQKTDVKKDKLYHQLKQKLINFYNKNGIDPNKPRPFNLQQDTKLLISCYPSELIVQILANMRKIIAELQGGHEKMERIGVIHLSSRFLQLVKSQSEYFQTQFKGMLQKLNQFFQQSLYLNKRINICTLSSLRGILLDPKNANTQLFHIGINDLKQCSQKSIGCENLRSLKIFSKDFIRLHLQKSATKLSASKMQQQLKDQDLDNKMQEQYNINEFRLQQQDDNFDYIKQQFIQIRHKKSKFISSVGFPKFISSKIETDDDITQFGLVHHSGFNQNVERKTIYDSKPGQKIESFQEKMLAKKQAKIQIMNIHFDLPELNNSINHFKLINGVKNIHKTQYQSSLKLIQLIKPNNIIFVNTPPNPRLFTSYQQTIQKFQLNTGSEQVKKIKVFDINIKRNCFLQFQNQLLQYRMNYLAQTQEQKVQRVCGRIVRHNNSLHIHLDCLENKKIVNFQLEKFYTKMRQLMRCRFIGNGLQIDGIRLYRKGKQIILQGQYSQQYFKIRRELYLFLGIN